MSTDKNSLSTLQSNIKDIDTEYRIYKKNFLDKFFLVLPLVKTVNLLERN